MSGAIAAIGGIVAGGAMSLYGAKKSSDAIKDSNKSQQKIADEANRLNYRMWLESRGIDENGNAVNTKLPRWAKARVSPGFRFPTRTPYSGARTAPSALYTPQE